MPLNVYEAHVQASLLSKIDPDLSYLWDELEVPVEIQANLSEREVRKLGVFAKVEPTEDAFREWLKADLGLNPAASVGERITVAKLAEAWEAARQRAVTTRKVEAEARVTGQSREMLKGVHLSLRRACARVHGQVEDRRCPGRAYLESRLEQLDDGEIEAEPLSKVTTVALEQESVSSAPGAGIDVRKDGILHVIKGKRTAPLPMNPEQFRAVMRVMGLHWEMIHLKGAGRAVLRDYTVQVFERHTDYLLGDRCLLIGEANPTMACSPTWDLLMKYELELRKFAARGVNEGGKTLADAMEEARNSIEHRTNYFITPLAMPNSRVALPRAAQESRGAKRPADDGAPYPADDGHERQADEGRRKGKAKGQSKGGKQKTGPEPKSLKSMSPQAAYRAIRAAPGRYKAKLTGDDGVPRCHRFQLGVCNQAGCKYSHVCVRCGGAHGVTKCPEMGLDKK